MKQRVCIILFVMTIGLLTACESSGEDAKEEEGEIVLTVLAGQSTSDAGIEDMIDEWLETKYPNVRLEWECVDWGDRFDSQMNGRIAAGDVPDIMIGKAQDVKAYARTGQLGVISDSCREKIEESALEAVTLDGVLYGMPYNVWYQGVIYNKNIFESLNLKPPETMEELELVIQTLESASIVPFASHFQESWNVANMTMQYMMNDIFKEDPQWGDKFRSGEVSCVGNEDVIACLENNRRILETSYEDALQIDQFESDSRFTQGEAAMYLTGSWSMQFANQYGKGIQFGIFPFPNESGNAALIRETNLTFMKSADSEYDDLIDEIFYSLQTDEKLAQEILDFTQSDSAVKGIEPSSDSKIREDIEKYEQEGRIIDVSLGNAQLVWKYQNEAAAEQLGWLRGEKSLTEVLEYMDQNRDQSGYGEE